MSTVIHMFPLSSPWINNEEPLAERVKQLGHDQRHTVLLAEDEIGKTSLLFQSAVTYACETATVNFVCRQALSRMPMTVHGMPSPDAAVLQLVKFMYLSDVHEFVNFLAAIHTKSILPDVIIVDDFDFYVNHLKEHGVEHGASKLCALLLDAVTFIQQKRGKCQLIMATSNRIKSLESVYRQFNFSIAHIHKTISGDREYKLELKTSDNLKLQIVYCIGQSGIMMKNLHLMSPDC